MTPFHQAIVLQNRLMKQDRTASHMLMIKSTIHQTQNVTVTMMTN